MSTTDPPRLSPTVLCVVEEFIAKLRADGHVDAEAIKRLEEQLSNGTVPKPDEINALLFPEETKA